MGALPVTRNLGDLAFAGAEPTAPWAVETDGATATARLTYGDLAAEADAVARGLLARGLARGDRVAILAENSARFLIAYLGTMRAGLVSVPVNWRLPADAIAHIHRDAGVALTLADAGRARMVPEGVPALALDGPDWEALRDPGPFTAVEAGAAETANILYTSGSTGLPKGVPLTHRGYGHAVQAAIAALPKPWGARALVPAPLYHMNALFFAKMLAASGAQMVLMRRFEARAYLEAAAAERCTLLTGIPTMLTLALRERDLLEGLDLSSVDTVMIGSSPVTGRLAGQIADAFPGATLRITYGTTEAGPTAFAPHPDGRPTPPTSLGVASPHAEVKLVGGPSDDEGVLWVKSPVVMPGYLNLPEKSAEKLHDGWYDTGDVMRRDAEGFFYFVDRADDMFVCGGENIHPGEVETRLTAHPDIAEACVVPVADEVKGALPAAFVVARPGATLAPETVKEHALATGPAYAHPRFVEVVPALPLSGVGKVDRKALKARAAAFSRDREETQ
ncbi:MAG: fatty-acyl-CoA synthase [Rhodobacteraceae bacterium HLUCCA09]|nr:MAG: fatty-acyl-CoA synthase [Rhodobacteraceae bacterium HLUCCA09]